MSKISLEPNDSGAGTFSIVSPDSNTNRTLELGDESGTIRVAETLKPEVISETITDIESRQNNFAQMPFISGDLIVESGSNSDGSFTRWADGTQICRMVRDYSGDSSFVNVIFPRSFIDTNFSIIGQDVRSSGSQPGLMTVHPNNKTVNSCEIKGYFTDTDGREFRDSAASDQFIVTIGLWK